MRWGLFFMTQLDMVKHTSLSHSEVWSLIRSGKLTLAGNLRLKIYGTLLCDSGKRMKRENRVFFMDEGEAIQYGYRPCGQCLKVEYRKWKESIS